MLNTLLRDAPKIDTTAPANVLRNVARWHQEQSARVQDETTRRRHRATRAAILNALGA